MSDKCPTCDGPAKEVYGGLHAYRSTTAEQRTHTDCETHGRKPLLSICSSCFAKLEQQLADKERELEAMRNHALGIAKAALQPLKEQLAAAEAVVEDAFLKLEQINGVTWEETTMEVTELLRVYRRKLQGGDGK